MTSMQPEEPVRDSVRKYAALRPSLVAPTHQALELVTSMLDEAGINYLSVSSRTKSVASFAAKAARVLERTPDADPLDAITDQIGVRVITYVHSDVEAVAGVFSDALVILDDRDMGLETASEGRFGYSSRHLLVELGERTPAPFRDLIGLRVSMQLRTVLQHAWAEFEHDVRYKGTVPESLAPDLDRRFTLAAGLLELADQEFATIRAALQANAPSTPAEADPIDPRISASELATFLAAAYADAGWSHTDHYGWISGLLLELGITSLDELAGLLTSVDSDAIISRMGYRYPAGAVRRLDDALLAIFGDQYVRLTGNAHRVPMLQARLETLREVP
ncbi:GTP pyrophosphokinase [Nocardioides gilvus]|uniref:GTP pyrophosphokinase n=1 Tax=Nocardioides gilvus TaxID=1735589 RepID=UPI000D74419A|nr:GTP pyrophosphokinase [Nocardioides gilvus]